MTKNNEQNNTILTDIKELLELWENKKQDKKAVNDFFKLENKIAFIDKINTKCLNCFLKAKDKNAFILIYDTDIFKYFLKAFYEKNGVFFVKKNDKLFLLYEDEQDILKCSDFKKYAYDKINENKEKERAKKEKLNKIKTGVQFSKMTSEQLNAVILQAKNALKQVKE